MIKMLRSSWFIGLILFQILPVGLLLFHLYGFSKRTNDSGWVTDKERGCKVFTNHNFQNRDVEWSGGCKEGFAHGHGELAMFEGDRKLYHFEGALSMGKIQGKGKIRFMTDGDVYEGAFRDSKIHGFGHFYNDDGDHYEGFHKNGLRSGYGTYWYDPESPIFKYEGEWLEGQEHGRGTWFYRNGKKESGLFRKGTLQDQADLTETVVESHPRNILITNDDGVEDFNRLKCLAEAVSNFADLVVIAVSDQNRSGTSNSTAIIKQGFVQARILFADSVRQIYAYEVQGYPADCVLFGALGVFREKGKSVDLVISGINGGPNIGTQWFGSGTIGAARTAALGKIPAIAVSGIDEENEQGENLEKICRWVAEIVRSPIIENIRPLDYLTISLPENLEKLKGIKVLERAITFDHPPFYLEKEETPGLPPDSDYRWKLIPTDQTKVYNLPAESDVYYYLQDYIVLVPMSVNENALDQLSDYQNLEESLPVFK